MIDAGRGRGIASPSMPTKINDLLFLVAHAGTFILNLSLAIILPNYLPVREYVFYGQASSAVNFLVPLCSAGLVPFVIRNYRNQDHRSFDLGYMVRTIFLGGCVFITLIFLASLALGQVEKNIAVNFLIYLMILATAASNISNALQRAKRQPLRYALVTVGGRLLGLGALIWYFSYGDGPRTVEAYLVSMLLGSVAILCLIRFDIFPLREREKDRSGSALKVALAFTGPAMVSSSIVQCLPFLERTILAGIVDNRDLAQYIFNSDMAFKALAVLLLISKLILFPRLSCGDPQREQARFRLVFKWSLILSAATMPVVVGLSPVFLGALSYIVSNREILNLGLLSTFGLISILMVLQDVFQMGLYLAGRTSVAVYSSLAILLVHGGIAPFAAKWAGVEAVAMSLLLSQIVGLALCYAIGLRGYLARAA